MIIIKDNERLYLSTWSYNSARILTKLATIVEDNGGKVKPLHKAIISNRTHDSAIRDYEDKLSKYYKVYKVKPMLDLAKRIREFEDRLEYLKSFNNEPITVTHTTYITFVLDGMYYYYQTDDNPFFDFFYTKTPVHNGEYNRNASSTIDNKDWHDDCFIKLGCSDSDINEAAYLIFNKLLNAKPTANHYRTLPGKIDF